MNLIRNYRNWRRYRDTVYELSRLCNRELTDLGISRSDIHLSRGSRPDPLRTANGPNQFEERTTMNLIRNYRNWRVYRETVTELGRLSNRRALRSRHRPRRDQDDRPQGDLTRISPGPTSSPTPTDRSAFTSSRGPTTKTAPAAPPPAAGVVSQEGSRPLKIKREEFRQCRSSSPATTNTVGLHLLPRIGRT